MSRGPWKKKTEATEVAKPSQPATGGSVTGSVPVRPQVKQMSGFKSAEDLEKALPESTATGTADAPRKRATKTPPVVDPFAGDARYQRGIANMAGFGLPRLVRTGFDAAAMIATDEEIRLSDAENLAVEDHLYVMSKHMNVKMGLGIMWLLFATLLAELIVKRLITRTEVGKFFADLFKPKDKKEDNRNGTEAPTR